MACFERASPALKEILLKVYRDEKPAEIDCHLHEFGSTEYHIQSSASDPHHTYLSISTPLLSQGVLHSSGLSHYTAEMVKGICPLVVDVIEPAREGYHMTLRVNFSKIPTNKEADWEDVKKHLHFHDSVKIITDISSVQAVILSSQLKEMLKNVNSQEGHQGMYKPIKLVYHPREPFFIIKQTTKIKVVFPMRFKEKSDVIIATAFLQELMDVANSEAFAKAPPCAWSPIPPPELRGESIEDLSTNGGFVSFDIYSRHVDGKKLDKTVWNLLNFYAFVKSHVKCTKGFIQRKMRIRQENLVQVLQEAKTGEDKEGQQINNVQDKRWKCARKLISVSKSKLFGQRWAFANKIRRIRSRIKIHGFNRFRRGWLKIPKFSSAKRYTKLE